MKKKSFDEEWSYRGRRCGIVKHDHANGKCCWFCGYVEVSSDTAVAHPTYNDSFYYDALTAGFGPTYGIDEERFIGFDSGHGNSCSDYTISEGEVARRGMWRWTLEDWRKEVELFVDQLLVLEGEA